MENSEDFTKLRNHLYKATETKWIYSLFVSVLVLAAAIVGAISDNPLWLAASGTIAIVGSVLIAWLREAASGDQLKGDKWVSVTSFQNKSTWQRYILTNLTITFVGKLPQSSRNILYAFIARPIEQAHQQQRNIRCESIIDRDNSRGQSGNLQKRIKYRYRDVARHYWVLHCLPKRRSIWSRARWHI